MTVTPAVRFPVLWHAVGVMLVRGQLPAVGQGVADTPLAGGPKFAELVKSAASGKLYRAIARAG